MTSASGMIGKEERGSDGSCSSSSSSSFSAEGPESRQGQGAELRLTDTGPVPLLKSSLIFKLSFMVVMILHMNVCRLYHTYGRRTFSGVCLVKVNARS